ncbi:MAG TPA: NYN domain-containing protein [Patescibacteria group bacterium]|nr:NYN domain-containing protein [Patescibacteria group bacterium]
MQHSSQRVGVFVDVQNMYYSARALYDQHVDFGEILKEAVGNRHLIRAFAYVIQADNEDEKTFFTALQERGFELRVKELQSFYGGAKKGDWDVGLSMDVVRMAPKLDAIVLVSGDGDFAELLRYVKALGCRAEVMAFGSSASSALRTEADTLCDLSQDTNRFLIPKKTSSSRVQRTASSAARPLSRRLPTKKDRTGKIPRITL